MDGAFGKTTFFGCPDIDSLPDSLCLCSKYDFGDDIKNCTNEFCTNPTDWNTTIQFALDYCGKLPLSTTQKTGQSNYIAASDGGILESTGFGQSLSVATTTFTAGNSSSTHTYTITTFGIVTALYTTDVVPAAHALSQTSTSTITTAINSNGSNQQGSSPSSGALSVLTQVGIGIGTTLGSVLVLLLVGCFLRLLARRKRCALQVSGTERFEKPELLGRILPRFHGRSELGQGTPCSELEAVEPEMIRETNVVHCEIPELGTSEHTTSEERRSHPITTEDT